jgi:hypothetical protein
MRFFVSTIHKEFGLKTLADETALHIDHRNDNRVDGPGFRSLLQFVETQITRHGNAPTKRN